MKSVLLSFTLLGRFAHFRVRYTTTSPLTHLVPPRHTLAGIIGAILGLQREEISTVFTPEKASIGVEVISKLTTLKLMTNLMKLKGSRSLYRLLSVEDPILIPFQLVREPQYIVYFSHEDTTLMNRLEQLLVNHECVYSPSLGLASLLANVEYNGKHEYEPLDARDLEGSNFETMSVAPLAIFNPTPTPDNHFVIDKVARHLNEERIPDGFVKIIFDANGKPMRGKIDAKNYDATMNAKLLKITWEKEKTKYVFAW